VTGDGSKIRLLLVDDSAVFRKVMTTALSMEPDVEVVGTAAHGGLALTRLERGDVDVVVLDVEMPEMDGLTALTNIRRRWPKLPVVMFSSLTERGAEATLEALARGATDYLAKPSGSANTAVAMATMRAELVPKLRAATGKGSAWRSTSWAPPASILRRTPEVRRAPEVVAIAASTGGPNALHRIFAAMPVLPVPVLVVQHMPPVFTRLLAERLSGHWGGRVHEGVDGASLRPGEAWIAPGGRHMEVVRDGAAVRLRLHDGAPEHSCRPAADVLLRSVASIYGAQSLAVVLTGMGKDALAGSQRIVEEGGVVLAQDDATSVVWGMPGFVARAGLAEQVLPLDAIAATIARLTAVRARPGAKQPVAGGVHEPR
jgi:two-component system chemotaxis response regulator CheB